jgi:hypothetical protein
MRLQSNFQPDIPSKAVSTLLEILGVIQFTASDGFRISFDILFQPFLRFWLPIQKDAGGALLSFNPS